jgi:DNA segregation ATPase FtsK/SpoIIIE, S-DNA-T family
MNWRLTLAKLNARRKLIKTFKTAGIYRRVEGTENDRYIYPKIHDIIISDNATRLVFSLPNGLDPKLITKNYFAFQQFYGKNIEIKGEIKTFELIVYQHAPSCDLPYDYETIKTHIDCHKLGIICGQDRYGRYVAFDLLKQPHILISGETGSGKSTQLRSILTTLIMTKKPSELELYLGDCKRQEFHIFRKVEHVQEVYSSTRDISSMLRKVRVEMDRRSKLTEVFEVSHVDDLPADQRVPYIVVCIDEFVMLRNDAEIMDILTEVVAIGRSLGVLAILSMQRPNAKVLDTTIRANLTVSMGFKLRDAIESKIVNTPNAHLIEKAGRFVMNSDKLYELQAPYLEMEEAKRLLNPYMISKGKVNDVTPKEEAPKQLTEEDVFFNAYQ